MPQKYDYDAIIVGGGHNGLTCAGYLQRAGLRTLVLERRPIIGGAVCTEEVIPGYKIDVGSSAHIMIHLTPVIRDLELERYGLEYCDMDPFAFYPIPDGSGAIALYRDVDKTCESIASVSPRDAEAYRRFLAFWRPINEAVFETFLNPPTVTGLFGSMIKAQLRAGKWDGTLETVRRLFTSYGQLIVEQFESEPMRAFMAWLGAQSGPPPDEIGSGDHFGWYAMMHLSGAKHPKGGSGMLTQAMARSLIAAGGEVRLDAPVKRILVQNNRVQGVELQSGERISAPLVVSNAHVITTMLDLVGAEYLPARSGGAGAHHSHRQWVWDDGAVRCRRIARLSRRAVGRQAALEPSWFTDVVSVAPVPAQRLCRLPARIASAQASGHQYDLFRHRPDGCARGEAHRVSLVAILSL
jgi:phytoene dehydrogenase-like protein